jgi:hypothetical protein
MRLSGAWHSGLMRVRNTVIGVVAVGAVALSGGCSTSRATPVVVTTPSSVDPKLLLTVDDFPSGFTADPVERRPKLDHCGVTALVAGAPSVVPATVSFSRSATGADLAQFVFVFDSATDADRYVAARRNAVAACVAVDKAQAPVEVRPLARDFGEGARFAFQLRKTSITESGDSLQDQVVIQRGRIVEIILNQSARVIDTNRTYYTVESALRRLRAVPSP